MYGLGLGLGEKVFLRHWVAFCPDTMLMHNVAASLSLHVTESTSLIDWSWIPRSRSTYACSRTRELTADCRGVILGGWRNLWTPKIAK